ncbi:hypothetical protein GE21DRAFT_1109972 [Neurospora crassa]|nr:hypothetical protein GE21DRAFT_1109972 [Neurospora crassa]
MKKEKTTNANTKRGGRTRKKWWFAFRFFWLVVMIPHPCLNTLSPLPSFTRIPFSYLPHQYLDSDSALTPSLGRRVGTEYLDPEREAATMLLRYRQCRVSWAFLFLVFALYTYMYPCLETKERRRNTCWAVDIQINSQSLDTRSRSIQHYSAGTFVSEQITCVASSW